MKYDLISKLSDGQKIPLFIIKIPNNPRSNKLVETLSKSKIFELIIFPAVMYQSSMTEYDVDYEFQRSLYGKKLSNGEIGCAISHCDIQTQLADSLIGGVILEDDARIPNLERFEAAVTTFLISKRSSASILSLLPWDHTVKKIDAIDLNIDFHKLFGQTPLNVGYALTQKAALELSTSNLKYAFLPDWPPNNANFFTTLSGVLIHGDKDTSSVLDLYGRNKLPRRYGLQKFLIYPYIKNRKYFSSLFRYMKIMILPSITWRIDNSRLTIKNKKVIIK